MSSSVLGATTDHRPADTHPPTRSGPAAPAGKPGAVSDLADALGRTVRAMHRAKAHFIGQDNDSGTDWSAHIVLARIVMDGPQRVSALADLVHSDASTVSRQVAAMVKDGLLERQADPVDGRASLLVPTERGRAAVAAFRAHRDREFETLLSDWSAEDCASLAALLDRFAGRVQQQLPSTSIAAPAAATSREEN